MAFDSFLYFVHVFMYRFFAIFWGLIDDLLPAERWALLDSHSTLGDSEHVQHFYTIYLLPRLAIVLEATGEDRRQRQK